MNALRIGGSAGLLVLLTASSIAAQTKASTSSSSSSHSSTSATSASTSPASSTSHAATTAPTPAASTTSSPMTHASAASTATSSRGAFDNVGGSLRTAAGSVVLQAAPPVPRTGEQRAPMRQAVSDVTNKKVSTPIIATPSKEPPEPRDTTCAEGHDGSWCRAWESSYKAIMKKKK